MLSQTFHYSVASVVSAAIGLLSAVVFTRLLSPEEYGVYVVGLSTAGIVSALLFTWVRVAALRFQSPISSPPSPRRSRSFLPR